MSSVANRVKFNEFVNISLVIATGSRIVLSKETIPYVARIAPMTNDRRKQLVRSYDSTLWRWVNKSHSTTCMNKALSRNHTLANVGNDVLSCYALMIIVPSRNRTQICTSVDTMDDIGQSRFERSCAHQRDLHRNFIRRKIYYYLFRYYRSDIQMCMKIAS